ncbi:hypothetical protein RUND412_010520 [Rhizina undulata]
MAFHYSPATSAASGSPPSYLRHSGVLEPPARSSAPRTHHYPSNLSRPSARRQSKSPAAHHYYSRRFEREDDPVSPILSNIDYYPRSPPPVISLPPPAVTSYAYASSASSYALQRSPLHVLQQQTQNLTTECQTLLDAQSNALMHASGSFPGPDKSSTKSKRHISLEEARNGITKAMDALADVKSAEENAYASQVAERDGMIRTLMSWGQNREVMEREIKKIEEGKDGRQVMELRAEKIGVEHQINHLRQQLHKLEMKHASLTSSLSILESTVASRTSSWNTSIQSLKQKTSNFLATHRQPTPQSAIEVWTLEKEALNDKEKRARNEAEALRDGIVVWEDVLMLVENFEENLRSQLSLSSPGSPSQRSQKEKVLAGIEEVISKVNHKLRIAEDKDWKLLVCAIGTELQAFKEARAMMRRSLGVVGGHSGRSSMHGSFSNLKEERDDEQELRNLGTDLGHSGRTSMHGSFSRLPMERDDEPVLRSIRVGPGHSGRTSMHASFSHLPGENDGEPGLRTEEEVDGEADSRLSSSSEEEEEKVGQFIETDGVDGAADPKDKSEKGKLLLFDYSPLDD